MPFGDIFSRFENVDLETAEGNKIRFKNNVFSRIGFKILGMPHIGMRLRAGKIMKNIPEKADRMLDAGFGSGIYSFSLASRVRSVEAIDIAQEKVVQAKKSNIFENINFQRGDLTKLRFESGSFGLVICSDVLEHIKNDEKAFSELARVLKKGGVLLLTVPSDSEKNERTYRRYGHERGGYSEKDIKELCKKSGLRIIRCEGHSSSASEVFSDISYRIVNNNLLLGILFYPIYIAATICDALFKDYNGLFFRIRKI